MIGWHPRPFIFVHIPRCAGTSIEGILIPAATSRRGFGELPDDLRRQHWLAGSLPRQHSKLADFAGPEPLERYFKFSFVRNPWDRAISQILHLQSRGYRSLFCGKTLKENIRIYCDADTMVHNHDLAAQQVDYLRTPSGDFGMDFVGRYESLQDDFGRVRDALGLARATALPRLKSSRKNASYVGYYDAESAEWVRQRFVDDIGQFGYTF